MNNENTLEQLEQLVVTWAEEKEIFGKATAYKQAQKTLEECGELLFSLGHLEAACNADDTEAIANAQYDVQDALGDIFVTIIIGAHMQGFTIGQCLQSAYDIISKRTGKMVNGQFVKDNA